jgi:putative toxin-antitoxin system antitoxin component (TIGR02293 family)
VLSTARLIEALGLGEALARPRARKSARSRYDPIIAQVRSGLPYDALEAVATRFEIPQESLARVLALPSRTLARRKKERRLRAAESDRLLRLSRVAALAEDVLGSREKAAAWLRRPNRALGGHNPLNQLDTDLGAHQLEQILLRIAHGVYS